MKPDAPIEHLQASAYRIATDAPEADGTLEWRATTLIVVHATGGGRTGVGYSYGDAAAAAIVQGVLHDAVHGCDALAVGAAWDRMRRAVRNIGRQGVVACAISAVDVALWDLKAKLLEVPLCVLLGMRAPRVPLYGSGGFTSYAIERLRSQLAHWAGAGFKRVKMKVGAQPEADLARVGAARDAIGDAVQLFVDANGAYGRKQALHFAQAFADFDVRWFEEPVSSDDRDGLRLLRERASARMDIAAGEYGWDEFHFRDLLQAGAVDVLQADATRCGGISGLLLASALADAQHTPLSTHCAPSLHLHVGCALPRLAHLEWFHDHQRIERLLFDGFVEPLDGELAPDLSRPGIGLAFKARDARQFEVN